MANEIRVVMTGKDDLSSAARQAASKAEDAFDGLAQNASKNSDKIRRDFDQSFDSLGEGAGGAEQKFIGFADTLSGTGDVMQGLRDGDMATLATGLADLSGAVEALWSSVGKAVSGLWAKVVALQAEAAAAGTSTISLIAHKVATIASEAATKAWAAAQWLLNTALSANPIGLVVVAIAALVAGIVIAYKNSETFRNIIDAIGRFLRDKLLPAIVDVATWVGGTFVTLFGYGRDAVQWIIDKAVALVNFVIGMPAAIHNAATGMWDGLKDAFRGAINWIISKWNGISFTLPSVDVPFFGKVGGFTLSTPDIPMLAAGGIVNRPTLAMIGEAGPEAVVPLSRAGGFGDTYHITVQALDGRGAAEAVTKALRDAKRYGLTGASI